MWRYRWLITLALLIIGLSGCDAINSASDTVDRAEVCTKALSAAGFNPDVSNPEGSVQDAQRRSDELRNLAEQTADANLQRELQEMADQMGQLKVSDVNPAGVADWGRAKLEQLDQLRAACA